MQKYRQGWVLWGLVGCDRFEFFSRAIGNDRKLLGREVNTIQFIL